MAITYGFYNSMNGDRKYNALQMSSIFDGVIRDGVFQSIGGYLATKPGEGMQVIVSPGKAWFDHTWTVNDADLPLEIAQSDLTLSRYDAVVLETDATKSVRENSIKVLKGTPASDPQKPSLTNEGDVHQHPLAYILVPGGSSSIQVQNIDIMVGKAECPFVTSILESVSIDVLLAKWEGEFRVWFDELQNQMAGDVATNLQNQITRNAPKVGDIVIGASPTRSGGWILCNGTEYDQVSNKKLKALLEDSTKINEYIPVVPLCSSVRFVGDMAFYKDKQHPAIAYPSKKLGGPDYSHPLNSKAIWGISGWNFLIAYANGFYMAARSSGDSIAIAYSKNGVDWSTHTIPPSSDVDRYHKVTSVIDVKYMNGFYYIFTYSGGGTFYIATEDIFSMTEYKQSDLVSILSQVGRARVYLNNAQDTIYLLSMATSSSYVFKITGPTAHSSEPFGRSVYNFDYLRMFELGGELWAIGGPDIRLGNDVYTINSKSVSSRRLGVRSDFYGYVGSPNYDVFSDRNGNVYYTYGGYLYKFTPGASTSDPLSTPYDTFPIFAGTVTGGSFAIGLDDNSNSHTLYADIDAGVFIGSEYQKLSSAGVEITRCRNNSPNITPYIATDFGYAFIKGDQ